MLDRASNNPALRDRVFKNVRPLGADDVMTIDGTVNKSIFSVLIAMAMAYWSFSDPSLRVLMWPAFAVGIIVYIVLLFKPSAAPIATPLYAAAQGIVVGAISLMYSEFYEGIVFQALSLTFATLFGMLILYKTGVIKVTERFKKIVLCAGAALFMVYMASFVMSMFGRPLSFLYGNGILSIGMSLFAVGLAAFFLVLDFDRIESVAKSGTAPKYMEWYCAFGLLVTLIWLYLELLHLLSKLQSRD